MKLGLIVEGLADGAVCQVAAQRLVNGVHVHTPTTMTNRPRLLQDCGEAAKALLTFAKCHKVLIVWDLHPNWEEKGFKPCRKSDRERALASLKQAGLEGDQRVTLVCIKRELETWLIADAAAVTAVLARHSSPDRIQKIRLPGKPERHADPKGWLEDQFRQNAQGIRYLDRDHAAPIMTQIGDLSVLRRVESFARFATKVTGAMWPPTAS